MLQRVVTKILYLRSVWPGHFCAGPECVEALHASSGPCVAARVWAERPLACSGLNDVQEEEKGKESVCEEVCPCGPYLCKQVPKHHSTINWDYRLMNKWMKARAEQSARHTCGSGETPALHDTVTVVGTFVLISRLWLICRFPKSPFQHLVSQKGSFFT